MSPSSKIEALHLPLEPFAIHIRSFTTNITFKRPFQNCRPIQIALGSDIILIVQLGCDVGRNRGVN